MCYIVAMNANTPIVNTNEPVRVAINGKELPPFHAMVVVVALQNFSFFVSRRNALGQGAEGLRQKYVTAIGQIETLYKGE